MHKKKGKISKELYLKQLESDAILGTSIGHLEKAHELLEELAQTSVVKEANALIVRAYNILHHEDQK